MSTDGSFLHIANEGQVAEVIPAEPADRRPSVAVNYHLASPRRLKIGSAVLRLACWLLKAAPRLTYCVDPAACYGRIQRLSAALVQMTQWRDAALNELVESTSSLDPVATDVAAELVDLNEGEDIWPPTLGGVLSDMLRYVDNFALSAAHDGHAGPFPGFELDDPYAELVGLSAYCQLAIGRLALKPFEPQVAEPQIYSPEI